ncbi:MULTISPECIES: TraR/DksA C4-type zinc finger protein [unclassified Undibacterium]|uniref:TraR/DksA family transcriptional regulator n=1 Tax=unclassified Undibacterium TaxID=2630295 RepID=UPI002AC8B26A|nr:MULTISPECIES: TraR/DksA C4-type zinc finger protein [unclassified Undibacterium]MEB0139287.1 TraR/DksA C4-type zinc finger protein [Undibacterium sp. CCC2.1]MEB0172131.1 TraR/DksA C4-type zinc finger protein [Undibacterium sp. CCC1.1]MEB0176006.1 TraR/DksA C4-type zinc finger protein [Undibacterium sp. CCC3.4]MEB0215318.1 TraR/DksA C4-type zinc finger protein [Undibacterium sp. 5I2]WPX45491.1 TraR/DksA C4-type zinc finger protein [Undibacterium sp. CCC3.4]
MGLNSAQQQNLKQILERMKQDIQTQLRLHDPGLLHVDSQAGDGVVAEELNHDAMSQYLRQHAEWQALQAAQARLSEDIIDICKTCAASIPFERLMAVPTTEYCIACNAAIEQEAHRLGLHRHPSM